MSALTQPMMEEGKKVVELLDADNYNPKAAFWIYNKELDAWQLLVGHVNQIGEDETAFSTTITAMFEEHGEKFLTTTVSDIVLALNDAPILDLLNSVVNTGDEILGISFTQEEINGVVIDGVYLYRMNI